MKLSPVMKETTEAKAVKLLRNYITSGSIAPGARITETNLSEEMHVSRATIRSALNILTAEGLVKLTPYTGWMVMQLNARDIWELYTLRSALERLGGRLAAEFINKSNHRALLQDAYAELITACKAGRQEAMAESDLNLHKTIIDISQNNILIKHNALIKQKIMVFVKSSNSLIADPQEILAQHTPIVEAILQGDAEKAGQLSEAHNLSEGEKLFDYVSQQEKHAISSIQMPVE